jgi:hypothetical protein
MTTHIFLALGMWPEVISQNTIAAGDRRRWQAGHYTYWRHYGLLQAGQLDSAAAMLNELWTNRGPAPNPNRRVHLALARAQQVITGERWTDSTLGWQLELPNDWANARAVDGFARGYAALRRGDAPIATAIAGELDALPVGPGLAATPRLLAKELRASLARAAGKKADAEVLLREVVTGAAALPMEFGPPEFVKPPSELLAEWLLEDGRATEAKRAFEAALATMPGRLRSTLGLAAATRLIATAGGR